MRFDVRGSAFGVRRAERRTTILNNEPRTTNDEPERRTTNVERRTI